MAETAVEEQITMAWAMSDEDLNYLWEAISSSKHVYFDLETTGLDDRATTGGRSNGGVASRVVLATFTLDLEDSNRVTNWVLPLSHPSSPFVGRWREVLKQVALTFRREKSRLIGHHVKFDARWVYATTGVDISDLIYWDTQVSSALEDENDSTRLEARAARNFGVAEWGEDLNLSYPGAAEQEDLFKLGEYGAKDTYYTYKLHKQHEALFFLDLTDYEEPQGSEEIRDARIGQVAKEVARPTVASLARMEQRGIGLDVPWTEAALAEDRREAARLYDELIAAVPDDELQETTASFAPTSKWFKRWAEIAEERGKLEVVAMTASGNPQWDKRALKALDRRGFTLAGKLLKYRNHVKRAEFLTSWLDKVTPEGRIHATYRPGGAVTGRLSASNPNMQQVTYALRQAFIPRPGYVIADIDYSQIEMRVAAFVSGCKPMLEAFQNGQDLHRIIAREIRQQRVNHEAMITLEEPHTVTLDEVTPEERQAGKAGNFGLLYGMGANGFQIYAQDAYDVTLTMEEAQETHDAFFTTWEGMEDWHSRVIVTARRQGYVTSPIGRVRRLPDIHSSNPYLSSKAERLAINAPVQGFASDLMQIATASIQGLIPGHERIPGVYPVASVHDSTVLEVKEENWEERVAEAIRRMVNLNDVLHRMDCDLTVPLAAEAVVGTRWGLSDVGELSNDEL